MGDATTALIDTKISRASAPNAACALYARLVEGGVIVPELRSGLSLGAHAFPLRADFRGLDDLEGWGSPERKVDAYSPVVTRITAIQIDVTGHGWQTGATGRPELVASADNHGLFMNYDGGFSVNCPSCRTAIELGADGSDELGEALDAWCREPESARLRCPSCDSITPVSEWRSVNYEFAAGHLGMTLWGEHLLGLVERPSSAAAKHLKTLFSAIEGAEPAVVFCNI
ncbi:hypothetical protein KDX23_31020 [Burkholderia vietnamiensis]|uniref:hypothetical protein n=1 Tax=Burkholderia vietnamiensis TaxID=60552 RepID=UPI001B9A3E19|nr:hypothetical protein [Burkholderia vietnamiensis]MBR8087150.1 hypothetical protein [Burkholderia vietnamiensis]